MKNKNTVTFILMFLPILLIFLFFYLELNKYLNLNYLKNQQENFISFYRQSPIQTLFIYTLIYIVSTALSIPGAALLTLIAGALFGVITGTVIVSFASTTGATLAFLTSRFILRDWVQKRFCSSLRKINKGIEKEGAFYLFTLRLVPVFPFFVVNLIMGLTPMKTGTFFFTSQVGMLAATIVFVNAGTQLAKIESLKGLLSPSLVFSFCLLGLFPITTKKLFELFKKD